jgi:hypothetical protein
VDDWLQFHYRILVNSSSREGGTWD